MFGHSVSQLTLISIYLSPFDEIGDHDDHMGVLLPDHLPKVCKSGRLWSLCGNISSTTMEPINEIGINVILVFHKVVL
jgi:hypothetical protein